MWKDNSTFLRAVFGAIMVVSVFVLPWWGTFGLAVIGILSFGWYLESVLLFFWVDVVFSIGWIPWLTISIFIILLVVEVVAYYISY